jgi:hypothetical protein
MAMTQRNLGDDGMWDGLAALDDARLRYYADTGRYHSIPQTALHERVRRWLAKADPAISGQLGSRTAWRVVCSVLKGFDVPVSDAIGLLQEWNARCCPPWTQGELMRMAYRAHRARDTRPRGYLIQ